MIDLDEKSLDEIRRILRTYMPGVEARVFGSRVNHVSPRYSDLDIALVSGEIIGISRLEEIRNAFSESDLPIQVDVLDWHAISPAFQKTIGKQYEVVQTRSQ